MKKLVQIFIVGFVATTLSSCGYYYDWSRDQHMKDLTNDGAAQLAHAKSSREIAVTEAKAKLESAEMLAAADTIRAHGVARSNQIIGESLKNNVEYLHWLWIDNLEKNPNAVIYVPTEANLPILEAGKNRLPAPTPKSN